MPKPRWMPWPQLLYAQVVKSYRRRRIVGVKHQVVFGMRETIESMLAMRGWKINTAFIERLNLDLRQHVAAIGRRVNTLCKHEAGLRQQLALFHTYHNFVLPHASLRLPLSDAIPGAGSVKQWQQPATLGDLSGETRNADHTGHAARGAGGHAEERRQQHAKSREHLEEQAEGALEAEAD